MFNKYEDGIPLFVSSHSPYLPADGVADVVLSRALGLFDVRERIDLVLDV